ncbi:hypothetical protein JW926_03735 [Candidatus Sumerlaeota bacterium]|nr:hypothetical protein [Candidatus Sumerlaeota bacterium]
MKRVLFLSLVSILVCFSNFSMAYTNSFTLNFESAGDTAGWSDSVNTPATTIVTGETTPADSPAYSPTPLTGAGYNSTAWMRIGQPGGDYYGIGLAIYDGTAGGSTTDPVNYTIEADVFVVIHATLRFQMGLAGRWTSASGNFPFELFHSVNVGQPDGYGFRSGGSTAQYGLFPAETTNRWVHMKMKFHDALVDVAIDNNMDGTDDYTQNDISLTATSGKAGFFSVINDLGSGGTGIPNQFSYFDNFKFTPEPAAAVNDWVLY